MCFSAQASFSAGAILFGISYVSFKNLKSKDLWPVAMVPLMFAIQQTLEGIVWLSKLNYLPEIFLTLSKYGFLFFAFVVWPFWMPFACWNIEKIKQQKQLLSIIMALGIFVSLALIWQLLSGVEVTASCNHLIYTTNRYYDLDGYALFAYCLATILPFFISSYKNMWVIGLMTAITLLLTMAFFWYFLTSVWCFFAAIVSAFAYLLVRKK